MTDLAVLLTLALSAAALSGLVWLCDALRSA